MTALSIGEIVAERTFVLTRDSLVRYAGASGDFNPIHYRDDIARSVGLASVLAHGMLTMGFAVQPVVDWIGDPARVLDYQVRFTRPVPVDATDGATVAVVAKVGALESGEVGPDQVGPDQDGPDIARIDLTVTFDGSTVLGKAQVRVRLG